VLESLRSNPVLASVSEEALGRIAEMVAAETRAQMGAALREVDLFDGLSQEDFEIIQGISDPLVLESGGRLFEVGAPGDHLFVVVRGSIRLTREEGEEAELVGVVEAGRAFGETALLGDAPRSVAATAAEPSYLIAISRDAFLEALGGDSLAVRLLRNLAKTVGPSMERPDGPSGPATRGDTPREALGEYNRMVRGRLLPRGMPHVQGFDVAATTVSSDRSEGAALWDWFLLPDGRLALAVLKVDQPGISAANRLVTVRGLLRCFAEDPIEGLGGLLDRVNRGLRSSWVDGISGSVSCGLVALSEGEIEWVAAGEVGGALVRANGTHEDLVPDAPSLGSDEGLEYAPVRLQLGAGDRMLVFSDGPSDALIVGRKVLAAGGAKGAKRALATVVDGIREAAEGAEGACEVTAALVVRSGKPEDFRTSASEEMAAYDAGLEQEAAGGEAH